MKTKIITLWQPWASLVALNLKRYETRSWPTNHRGPLLIHAAKRPFVTADYTRVLDNDAYRAWMLALDLAYEAGLLNDQSKMPFGHQLPLGAVVAIAELKGCYRMKTMQGHRPEFFDALRIDNRFVEDQTELERAVGDWQPGRYAWDLPNVQRLPEPIPWRGVQGLRDAPPELQSLVAAAPKVDCLVPF